MVSIENHSLLERMSSNLPYIERVLNEVGDQAALDAYRGWIDRSFSARLADLGFEPRPGESQEDAQSRAYLIDIVAGSAHNQTAVAECVKYADREAENPTSVDGNLASVFVTLAAQFGDRERMDRYVRIYQQRKAEGASPQETDRYLASFAEFRPPELVTRTLELMDEGIIPQEAVGVLLERQLLPNSHSQLQAWDYVKRRWEWLHETLGDMWIGRIVFATGSLPPAMRDDMLAFFNDHLEGITEKSQARALEALDLRAEFVARTKGDLLAWFKSR